MLSLAGSAAAHPRGPAGNRLPYELDLRQRWRFWHLNLVVTWVVNAHGSIACAAKDACAERVGCFAKSGSQSARLALSTATASL
jgi:hypothetical protein